ncbi:MAG: hypothetical protein B1H02_05760 [Candidatus Latescibacteria bacterium 4484_107]|nr:MAG: hypothetical protein B1H02_05760 [Candidatus Latescibacteria bacterium 4484_107]
MIKNLPKTSLLVILLGLMTLPFAHCARNTLGEQYDDGRVYFIIDLNPDWFRTNPNRPIEQGRVIISYTLEGEEPVSGLAYSVADFSGQRFDLVERSIKGGTEVRVSAYTVHQGVNQSAGVTFNVDGNVTLRFRLKDPTDRGSSLVLVME